MGPSGLFPRAGSGTRIATAIVLLLLGSSARSEDRVLFSTNAGECTLSAEWSGEWHTLRLRTFHPSGKNCFIDQHTMTLVLDAALSKLGSPGEMERVESLYIGRLIEYPWLSRALAVSAWQDKAWDGKRGRSRYTDINAYVAKTLSGEEHTMVFDETMARNGYRIRNASVEKVLVGRFRDVPSYRNETAPGRVPYDAQLWFRLERN